MSDSKSLKNTKTHAVIVPLMCIVKWYQLYSPLPIVERATQTQLSELALCPKQVTSDSNLLAAALRNAPLQPVDESTSLLKVAYLPNKTRTHFKHVPCTCQLVDRNLEAVKTAIVKGNLVQIYLHCKMWVYVGITLINRVTIHDNTTIPGTLQYMKYILDPLK